MDKKYQVPPSPIAAFPAAPAGDVPEFGADGRRIHQANGHCTYQ